MPRPPLKADRAYLPPEEHDDRSDSTPEEWHRYADDLGHAVSSWLHYLETGEKK